MGGSADQVVGASGDLYEAPAIALRTSVVEMDLVPNTAMRAPGESVGSFAMLLQSGPSQLESIGRPHAIPPNGYPRRRTASNGTRIQHRGR